jgi:signal transduction histidine kinase
MGGAVIRIDDVSDRVRLEELMIQSEKMMSIGGLAAGMAHEINNPLAAILQYVQLIRNRTRVAIAKNQAAAAECGITMSDVENYMSKRGIFTMIDAVLSAGQRASKIVENMLSFSRRGDMKFQYCNLTELLDRTVELAKNDYDFKKKYDFKTIEIVRDYDPGIPKIACEGSQIQQVFLNILKNGAQAMYDIRRSDGSSSRFHLKTWTENEMVCIGISDNGPGMAEETRKRVFEPFFTTKDVGVGTGLGLSLSYFIVTKNHNGHMSVESSPDKGTRFIIRLPLNQVQP